MKKWLSSLMLIVALLSIQAHADSASQEHGSLMDMGTSAANRQEGQYQTSMSMTNGTVRKIDHAQGKITLKHEAIQSLSMPGMVMVFKVKDPAILDKFSVGENVQFAADRIEGELSILLIEKI